LEQIFDNILGHQAAVFCVDMDSLGEYAFSASADHTVRVWDINQGSCTKVGTGFQLPMLMWRSDFENQWCNCPLPFEGAFIFFSSENSWVPIHCWVNKGSL